MIKKASAYVGKAKDVAANSSVVKKLNQVSDSLEALRDKAARRMGLDKFARNEQRAGKGLGKQPTSFEFDMVNNPGPLATMRCAPAANFAGGKYNMITLKEDVIIYRAGFSEKGYKGERFSLKSPSSRAQVRIDHAVKPHWVDSEGIYTGSSPLDCYYSVKVPKGCVYQWHVANQGEVYVGGRGPEQVQIFIPDSTKGLLQVGPPIPLQ